MRKIISFSALVLVGLILTACGNKTVGETLGLRQQAPDEFQVYSRAPLTVPPEVELRPPQPGAARPQEIDPRQQARSVVFGTSAEGRVAATAQRREGADRSVGETALLDRAGTRRNTENIREIVNREAGQMVLENRTMLDQIIFWQDGEDPTAVLVDPVAESQRLQENRAAGAPINMGDTATIERQSRTPIEEMVDSITR